MTKRTLQDLEYFDPPATVYKVNIFRKGEDLTAQDIDSIVNTLRRYQAQYPFCSFLLGISETDPRTITQLPRYKRYTKPGRPKNKMVGKKVPHHLHVLVLGDETRSARSFACKVVEAVNKRFGKKVTRKECCENEVHAAVFINYVLRQAEHIRTGGDFDFSEYRDVILI